MAWLDLHHDILDIFSEAAAPYTARVEARFEAHARFVRESDARQWTDYYGRRRLDSTWMASRASDSRAYYAQRCHDAAWRARRNEKIQAARRRREAEIGSTEEGRAQLAAQRQGRRARNAAAMRRSRLAARGALP